MLADHNCKTDESCEDEVNDEECEAAVLTHFVREAPNVAQTDRRTDSGHDKSKAGAKSVTICFFHILSLLL